MCFFSCFFLGFFRFFGLKDKASEENDIHHDEESNQNSESKLGLCGSEIRKKHKWEAEDDSGEVLVDHIISRGSLEFAVNLTEKDRTCASGTGKHAVHHKELLFLIIGEQLFTHYAQIYVGRNKSNDTENNYDAPIAL